MVQTPDAKIKLQNGQAMLVMVKDGVVTHFNDMALPHAEFVRRATGTLPEGAWVGTVSKLHNEIAGITSKHFFGYQLPAPEVVDKALKNKFE
jgi:hypothetical protein